MSSSVSADASTETCGENARSIRSLMPTASAWVEVADNGDACTVVPPGEKIEPLTIPAFGVIVPDSLGEAARLGEGSALVDANKFEMPAFGRRYCSPDTAANGDLPNSFLEGDEVCDSEADSCCACSASSGNGGIREAGYLATTGEGYGWIVIHLSSLVGSQVGRIVGGRIRAGECCPSSV
jgi:hypothetical protein